MNEEVVRIPLSKTGKYKGLYVAIIDKNTKNWLILIGQLFSVQNQRLPTLTEK